MQYLYYVSHTDLNGIGQTHCWCNAIDFRLQAGLGANALSLPYSLSLKLFVEMSNRAILNSSSVYEL